MANVGGAAASRRRHAGRVVTGVGRKTFRLMLANFLIFAFAVGLVVAYVAVAIKTVNESES